MSTRTRILLAAALVLGIVAWALFAFAREHWQQFSVAFWDSLAHANPSYLLVGAGLTFTSYFARCLRWRVFLHPIKDARLWNLLVATLIGFSAIALASRTGEIVRPWLIAQKEQLPLSTQLGAWTLERVFDTLTLVSLLGVALWLLPAPDASSGASALLAHFRSASVVLMFIALLMAAVLAQLRYFPRFTAAIIGWLARPLPERYRAGLRQALEHFGATLAAIENGRRFLACVGWSLVVWLTLVGAYWSTALSFGEPLSLLHPGAMVLVMVASVTGSIAYLPAVGGGTQVATTFTLAKVLGIPLPMATSMALTVWTMTYLLVLIPGLPLAASQGLTWGRFRNLLRTGTESTSSPPSA
jgi:uncharacterized protein (TIRG00374 family)